jgi:hypothetical protein
MCREPIGEVLKRLDECRDAAAMRRLLQDADPCRGCPEAVTAKEPAGLCRCRLQSRQDLQDRIHHLLAVKSRQA